MIQGFRRFKIKEHVTHDDFKKYVMYGATNFPWYQSQIQAACRTRESLEQINQAVLSGQSTPTLEQVCTHHLENDQCKCGIYITKEPIVGRGVTAQEYDVLAQVVGWGHYIEYEEGWRTQFCRIDALTLVGFWTRKEAETIQTCLVKLYEVPCAVEALVTKYRCCNREHNENFWVDPTTHSEVTICKLSMEGLVLLYDATMKMGQNEYALKVLRELVDELDARV